jgi:hypothetical protein
VLQWLRANGCPWDARTCTRAEAGGHTELLRWSRANGCPDEFVGGVDGSDTDEA